MDEYSRMEELLVQTYNTLVAWHQVIADSDALDELGIEVDKQS